MFMFNRSEGQACVRIPCQWELPGEGPGRKVGPCAETVFWSI